MTTMQIAEGDRDMLLAMANKLIQRRRQLCPFPLTIDQIEECYIRDDVYRAAEKIQAIDEQYQGLFNSGFTQNVNVGRIIRDHVVRVEVRVTRRKPIKTFQYPYATSGVTPNYEASCWPEFREWTREAAKVYLVNEKTMAIFEDIVRTVTTYKQLYKALPESMQALTSPIAEAEKNNEWVNRRARVKFTEVHSILREEQASRAKSLPVELSQLLAKHRTLVETTFAMAVMLPSHEGLENGSVFDNTWISRVRPVTE